MLGEVVLLLALRSSMHVADSSAITRQPESRTPLLVVALCISGTVAVHFLDLSRSVALSPGFVMVGPGPVCAWKGCSKTTNERRFGQQKSVQAVFAELCPMLLKTAHSDLLCGQHYDTLRKEAKRRQVVAMVAAAEPLPLPPVSSPPSSPPASSFLFPPPFLP